MRGRTYVALLTLQLAALAPSAHAADRCGNPRISTCINSDTFWPHAGAAQMLTVGGTETVTRGQMGFGLVTSYLSRPITLHLPSPGPGGSDAYVINDQVNGTFLWGYGVTNRLELDVALPITFGQGGSGVQPITGGTGIQDTAMRDLRFGAAYAIIPRTRTESGPDNGLALTGRLETSAPTGDADQFAGERAAVFVPSVAADMRVGRFVAGAEVGARLRPTYELTGARVGSQVMVAGGVGFDILAKQLLGLTAEVRALPTFAEQRTSEQSNEGLTSTPNGKHIFPAEWAASLRTAPLGAGDFAIQLGGGGSLTSDAPITTPRYRFSLSIRYAPLTRAQTATAPSSPGSQGGPQEH
jgi:hypothetical protein